MTTTDSRQDTTADSRLYSSERDAPLDATLGALADRQCRVLLRHLRESDDALVVTDLASRLVEGESDADEVRLRARLHHTHLPKLDDAGLVEYDAENGLVRDRTGSRFAEIVPTIEAFESGDPPVSLDAVFRLLSDFRRREALLTLLAHSELSLPDLADEVTVAERDAPLPEIDPDVVLKVYLSLYHTHVPKLAEAGVVEYNQEDDYVTLTETGRALEPTVRDLCDAADG